MVASDISLPVRTSRTVPPVIAIIVGVPGRNCGTANNVNKISGQKKADVCTRLLSTSQLVSYVCVFATLVEHELGNVASGDSRISRLPTPSVLASRPATWPKPRSDVIGCHRPQVAPAVSRSAYSEFT
jgi:hypothetical protein